MEYVIAVILGLLSACVMALMHATKDYEYDFIESERDK